MNDNNGTVNVDHLKNLGHVVPYDRYNNPDPALLEIFENPYKDRKYSTQFVFEEFTSLCPKTGQPDFGVITIQYFPNKSCLETKALKIYLGAYRQYGAFMEAVTNKISDDLVNACDPYFMRIEAKFNRRGGTDISVIVDYVAEE
jgi:7-cyano-7-deazaguanine reductase